MRIGADLGVDRTEVGTERFPFSDPEVLGSVTQPTADAVGLRGVVLDADLGLERV